MKLIAYFLVIALLVAVVGYVGFSGTTGVSETYDEIADETSPALLALGKIESSVHRINAEATNFALIHSELGKEKAAAAAAAELEELEEAKEELEFWEDEFDKVAEDEVEKQFVEDIEESEVELYNAALALVNAKKEGKSGQEILDLRDKVGEAEEKFEEIITNAIEVERNELEEGDEIADALATKTTNLILITSIIAILFSIGLGLFVSQRITKPLESLNKAVDEVSKGNFKAEVKQTSSIKEINQLTDSLDRVMTTMKLAVEEKGPIKIKKEVKETEPEKEEETQSSKAASASATPPEPKEKKGSLFPKTKK